MPDELYRHMTNERTKRSVVNRATVLEGQHSQGVISITKFQDMKYAVQQGFVTQML
jgi:hypothetical protein